MIISSAEIQMASSRQYVEKNETREDLTIQQDGRPVENGHGRGNRGLQGLAVALTAGAVKLSISEVGVKKSQHAKEAAPPSTTLESAPLDSLKFNILRLLIERLTGRKVVEVITPADLQAGDAACQPPEAAVAAAETEPQKLGWGMAYDYHESHYEAETTQFSAQGVIRTGDGKEVAFAVDLTMNRTFASEENISIRAGDKLKDPLVINFDGNAAELTQTHFAFDLDADGREEQIASLAPGSGLLALDRNGDGRINDGNELFGPATGDGFAELASFDADKNNWIDENDPIFDRLRIWQKDAEGKDQLFALGSLGVGAIYLGSIGTPFSLKDSANELQGAVRSTGIFVRENLTAGTVQQVDLVV